MKAVVNNLGKALLAVIVVALAVILISSIMLPGVRDFVGTVFPDETNYVDRSHTSSELTLSCASEIVSVAKGDTADIFTGITALSKDNENILSQLTEDYEKPVEEREHVFIYKLNDDNSSKLVSKIDTSVGSRWAVFYLLNDTAESVSLKVIYTVN